jgi:Fe-S cluster assembly protein SufD
MATLTATQETRAAAADERRDAYVAEFERFAASRPASEPGTVADLRRAGIEGFAELGFPSLRWEEWRKTDVRPIVDTVFERATGPAPVELAGLAPHLFDGAVRLVFVDGFYAAGLSAPGELPEGAYAGSLAAALEASPERLEPHLGRHVETGRNPFAALNTAFFADGALVHMPRGTVFETPIHLVFVSTVAAGSNAGRPKVSYPRNLYVAGEASQLTVVETYVGAGEGVYFNCAATEIVVGPGAVVDHYKVQHESREAYHVTTQQLHQVGSSSFSSHSVMAGGAITRNDVNAVLDGEGIDAILNGLYLVNGTQLVDNHMRVDHAKPHGDSHELYKGVLDESAKSVFNGLIYVHPGAQKTDAKQTNRNLLLSPGALASSNPQLEIFADDVKCTHGSTIGQLDEEAVFYLRSRGIGEEAAKSLLTYAFAADVVERIKVAPVRKSLEDFLFARLPRGETVRDAV